MKNIEYNLTIIENRQLSPRTFLLRLDAPEGLIEKPGQFVNIAVDGKFLRRPISVCDFSRGILTLLYDVVGDGTRIMSQWRPGHSVNLLAPLGNGFDTSRSSDSPLLIGGGIGIAPLYMLGKALIEEGKRPVAILGFNTGSDVVWTDEFREAGIPVFITTANGEVGEKGFVTDSKEFHNPKHTYFYACGPMPMLKALGKSSLGQGELSLDERMACGFGICRCCTLPTKSGPKQICKDGPVFRKEEIIWD